MENKKYFEDYTEDELEKLSYNQLSNVDVKDFEFHLSEIILPKGVNTKIDGVKGVFYTNEEMDVLNGVFEKVVEFLSAYYNITANFQEFVGTLNLTGRAKYNKTLEVKKRHEEENKSLKKVLTNLKKCL